MLNFARKKSMVVHKIDDVSKGMARVEASSELLKEKIYILRKFPPIASKLIEMTGWDYAQAENHFVDAYRRTECTSKEYMLYKFYELSEECQNEYFLISMQKKLRQKYDASKKFVGIICDKAKTNEFFSEYVRRPWCVNSHVSFEQFSDIFKATDRIMYKPVNGHCGYGAEAFDLKRETIKDVYDKLITYPKGVVEEFVVQHSEMGKLCSSSVNTLRFVTFSSRRKPVTEDGKMVDIAYSIVRIGREGSVVDNFHSGGIVANVDLENHTLATDGTDQFGNVYKIHPDTGTQIKGFKIPFVDEAKEMVLNAIESKQVRGYLGWDIAITQDGPKLIEVNTCPSAECLQTPFAPDNKGMRHIMEKYI